MNNNDLLQHVSAAFALEAERIRDEMALGMTAFDRGNRITAARYRPLAQYANQVTWNAPGRLVGWSVRVRGGTVIVTLHDGHDATGDEIAAFTMANNGEAVGSSQAWFGPGGLSFTEALYIEVTLVTGAPVLGGAVYLGVVD